MRKKLTIAFIVGMILLSAMVVKAQTTNPWSAGSDGKEKNTFSTLDDVYIKSNSICEPATEVDLYLVYNIDDWEGGEFLEDIREEPQTITLTDSKIPLSKLISKPESGEYDIVIDCNQNGEYDQFIDKIDKFSGAGFEVEAVGGTGKASIGSKNPGKHNWRYDPEEPSFINPVIQLSLLAEGEDIELDNITLKAKGSGDDSKVETLEIYVDENKNGKVDVNEILIGDSQPAYTSDGGRTVVDLDYFLTDNLEESILIVYVMDQSIEEGEFSLTVESLYGIGEDSSETIRFSGPPFESGITTALPEKTCLGTLSLKLTPNPAAADSEVTADISGLSGCVEKKVSFRKNPCGASVAEEVGSCTLNSEGKCEIKFAASTALTYHACIDKNEDGDMIDVGEYDYKDLNIKEFVEETAEENMTEEGMEEETEQTETSSGITGEAISENLSEVVTQTNSFFILLEVTLLLILFVLVMILFKLRGPATSQPEKEEEKEEKPEKKRKGKEKEKEEDSD